jgi:hypothetical protein
LPVAPAAAFFGAAGAAAAGGAAWHTDGADARNREARRPTLRESRPILGLSRIL